MEICQRPQPPRILKSKRRQQQENGICKNEPDQPLAEFKCGHRKPFVFGAHRQNSRVVNGKEARQRLIRYVRAKRKAEQKPSHPKVGRLAGVVRQTHALDCTSDRLARLTVHLGSVYSGFVGGSAGASLAPFGLKIVESVSTLNFL